jgi:hypothetical protein
MPEAIQTSTQSLPIWSKPRNSQTIVDLAKDSLLSRTLICAVDGSSEHPAPLQMQELGTHHQTAPAMSF